MQYDLLWAPWREAYVKNASGLKRCVFCAALRRRDRPAMIVKRGRTCFAILNIFPYNNGHVMIAPIRHRGRLGDLTSDERAEFFDLTVEMQERLDRALRPHGYNLGINVGRPAGAGVLGHVHLHVVPRWNGDTNFMPVTGGTKVMPMSLAQVYSLLTRRKR